MYRPLPPYLEIRDSSIEGKGIFTKHSLPEGVYIGITHLKDDRFQDGMIRTPLGGFINHSPSPNCKIKDFGDIRLMQVKKEVKAEEELTVSYKIASKNFKP